MTPPFFGTKIKEDFDIQSVLDHVDREVLFAARWNLKADLSGDEWQKRKLEVAEPVFTRLSALCLSRNLIRPRLVYGHFACEKRSNSLFVKHGDRVIKFDFPRERATPNRCLADFFPEKFLTMMLVTIGNEITSEGARLFKADNYTDAFYLKGLAAQSAEALAKISHEFIAGELGYSGGVRFSFGYPTCPNLMDQEKLYKLLEAKRIGVALSKTMHLVPEYSTSAIISFDEKAARFIP